MNKPLLTSWFGQRDYLWIYAHRFFFMFATAAGTIYRPAYFLDNGMPLWVIILSWAVLFAASGITAPFTYKYVNRIGVSRIMLVATVMNIICIILTAYADRSLVLGFCSALFGGVTWGVYYPVSDMLESLYVTKHEERGRQYTFGMAMATLGAALGAVCGGAILAWSNFYALAALSAFLFCLSFIPFLCLTKTYEPDRTRHVSAVFTYMFSRPYRAFHLPFFGGQLTIIALAFVPLFVFTVVGNYAMLGIVIAAATIIELLVLLFAGHRIDEKGSDYGLAVGSWASALGMIGYILFAVSAWPVFLIDSWTRIATNINDSAFMTFLHGKVQRDNHDPLLFGTAMQISYCIFEVFTLIPMALLAWWLDYAVFTVIFLSAACGFLLLRYTLPKQ